MITLRINLFGTVIAITIQAYFSFSLISLTFTKICGTNKFQIREPFMLVFLYVKKIRLLYQNFMYEIILCLVHKHPVTTCNMQITLGVCHFARFLCCWYYWCYCTQLFFSFGFILVWRDVFFMQYLANDSINYDDVSSSHQIIMHMDINSEIEEWIFVEFDKDWHMWCTL